MKCIFYWKENGPEECTVKDKNHELVSWKFSLKRPNIKELESPFFGHSCLTVVSISMIVECTTRSFNKYILHLLSPLLLKIFFAKHHKCQNTMNALIQAENTNSQFIHTFPCYTFSGKCIMISSIRGSRDFPL